jgi:F-type H+-transporting ATPase subunit gamma
MANAKEIRGQIKSIRNTAKITKAMEMVAASKMRKAQERMEASRPYAQKMRKVIGHLRAASPDNGHPFLQEREARNVGYIIVSTDRGLCGGLNANMFRAVLRDMQEWRGKGADVALCLMGSKAASFFRRVDVPVVASVQDLGEMPHIRDLIGAIQVMLDAYREAKVDRVYLVHNEFINTMTQRAEFEQLLPLETIDTEELQSHWDYIYETSDVEVLMDAMLARYIESQVFRGVLENGACEQAARMVAMKSATDNAGNLIDDLELVYNKARQAAITQELSEIVGGAAAV